MAARHVFRWVAKACWRQQAWIDDYSRHNPAYRFAYDVKKERCKIGDYLPVLQLSLIHIYLYEKVFWKAGEGS